MSFILHMSVLPFTVTLNILIILEILFSSIYIHIIDHILISFKLKFLDYWICQRQITIFILYILPWSIQMRESHWLWHIRVAESGDMWPVHGSVILRSHLTSFHSDLVTLLALTSLLRRVIPWSGSTESQNYVKYCSSG